ncbi:MAG TPA: hypothetical protein VHA35_20440, partial [Dongiaceae bacterium]|nr:hypothetical protein [Dongiaceae bacterium]
ATPKSVAKREAAAIRSDEPMFVLLGRSVAKREAAAIRSVTPKWFATTTSVAKRVTRSKLLGAPGGHHKRNLADQTSY